MIGINKKRRLGKNVARYPTLQDQLVPLPVPPDELYFAFNHLKHVLDCITLMEQVSPVAKHTLCGWQIRKDIRHDSYHVGRGALLARCK